jgi:hypothetical protein
MECSGIETFGRWFVLALPSPLFRRRHSFGLFKAGINIATQRSAHQSEVGLTNLQLQKPLLRNVYINLGVSVTEP